MQDLSSLLYSPVLKAPGSHDPYTPRHVRALSLSPLFQPDNRHVWIGAHPPFECTAVDVGMATGFRAASCLHGQFDVAWCAAPDAYGGKDWPIVLDEVLRLIARTGHLVLNIPQHFSEMARIKNYLKRKFGFDCKIVDELSLDERIHMIVAVERTNFDNAHSRQWSIGILASGQRSMVVEQMVRSIRNSRHNSDAEILIFGPEIPSLCNQGIRFLQDNDYGINPLLNEISRKKNILGDEARNENIIICHDRYYLDENFFENFANFGMDFDFATVRQIFEDGQTFPSMGEVGGLLLNHLNYISDNASFVDDIYINGGFFIVKKSVLSALPLNDLCFWNQAEDAEYAVLLRQQGIIPRYNAMAQAFTTGISKKHCAHFRNIADQNLLLLSENRAAARDGGTYYWCHPDYAVSEQHATLRSGATLALLAEPDSSSPAEGVAVRVSITPQAGKAVEYRTPSTGWVPLESEREVTLWIRQRGGTTPIVEFRDGTVVASALEARAETPAAAVLKVLEVRTIYPVIFELNQGTYPREDSPDQYLNWLQPSAEISLFNPNPFAMTRTLHFAYRHITDDGETDLLLPNGQVVRLKGAYDSYQTLMRLEPGITMLRFHAANDAIPPVIPNETRSLWLALINHRLEPVAETWLFGEGSGQGVEAGIVQPNSITRS